MGAIRRAFLPVVTSPLVHGAYRPALTVLGSIFATDRLDGVIASRTHTVSALGTWLGLDPSDRVLGGAGFLLGIMGPGLLQSGMPRQGLDGGRSAAELRLRSQNRALEYPRHEGGRGERESATARGR